MVKIIKAYRHKQLGCIATDIHTIQNTKPEEYEKVDLFLEDKDIEKLYKEIETEKRQEQLN